MDDAGRADPAGETGSPTATTSPAERTRLASEYVHRTNPHDGHQLLNKPWVDLDDDGIDIVQGSQHKYPQCQLVFDNQYPGRHRSAPSPRGVIGDNTGGW